MATSSNATLNQTVVADTTGADSGTQQHIQQSVQLLTFMLDNEVYGTDISQIQEVLEYRKVTGVPRTPEFMLGVINLRGRVVPVVDLRCHFGMRLSEMTVNTCIVIVDVVIDGETTPLGILADAVREVVELEPGEINPPPRIGSRVDTRFISGMGKYDDDFIIILNLPKVFSEGDIADVFDSINNEVSDKISEQSEPPSQEN